ncbi:alpha/beta hydrolase [Salinisphaera sp. P385]|uniref:Alpha/beta hydrolase n=1 Tax=Spectribacter acetivorans TaxID=3075603 RepID=A0ABU3B3S0_9GAMM|nr:alpha/beta hydrolase [Salinisphaera sp. P385]MDT0617109.1 alpha/beta hydrolase [Salinisphaera sp. P385]
MSRRRPLLRALVRRTVQPMMSPRMPVGLRRTWMAAMARTNPCPRGVRRSDTRVDSIPLETLAPVEAGPDTILYLHGGGYVFGSPATHRALTGHLALATGATVRVPDYRLAPEHPFPAARDDALAVYRWLLDRGIEPSRILFAGDSAGGGLALSTAMALHEAGLPQPAGLALISPWADLTGSGRSMTTHADIDPMLTTDFAAYAARAYAGDRPLADPGLSPLFGDFHGLPPMLVHLADDEILVSEGLATVKAARAAGVPVTLTRFPDLWHVFHLHAGLLPEADAAVAEIADFARACWQGQPIG